MPQELAAEQAAGRGDVAALPSTAPREAVGRSRGGLTTKIHLTSDGSRRSSAVLIAPGQWGDAPQLITVLDRIRVPRPSGGRARMRPNYPCGSRRTARIGIADTNGTGEFSTQCPSVGTNEPTVGGAGAEGPPHCLRSGPVRPQK